MEASQASLVAKRCLRFLVLTAVRSGEVRGAVWSEIDLDAREWRIPGARMKSGAEHRVPLSNAALAVLEQARTLKDESDLIFPSPLKKGRPLSDMTMTKLLRDVRLAERATVHGFRSSFRDWCAETDKPRELAEAALAHTVGGVEGAYFRSDLIRLRMKPSVQPAFLRHYINSPVGRPRVLQLAQGAIQKNISGTRLRKLSIPLPPLPEQTAIAATVKTID